MRATLKTFSAMAAVALALCAAPAFAATVISAGRDADCGKTTCFNDSGVYTHTWSASGASGPVDIGALLLDRSILGDLDGKMFRLSFQLGGVEVGSWGKYLMAGIGGDTLTFSGTGFVWNPEDGDLVLVLELIPPPKPGALGFSTLGANTFTDDDQSFAPQDNTGGPNDPPTGIDARQPGAPVPEPAAWAMMITGFGLAGAMMRRRRTVFGLQP